MWTTKKKIYYILYVITAKWLPESRHMKIAKKLRGFWARRIISDMGTSVNVERGARFSPELKIGSHSGIGINAELYGPVIIGERVLMGPEVIAYTQNHKHEQGIEFGKQGYEDVKPVKIGNNVWIGRRAMFMPGSEVGNNVVVAAGTIVTKKFPSDVIVGGVPAKIIEPTRKQELK